MNIPIILNDYLQSTGQTPISKLSESHLLNEAEWCLYNAYENQASCAYSYHGNSKKALKNYVDKLKNKGVVAKRDFD